jgi:predicted Zn-dependent protease
MPDRTPGSDPSAVGSPADRATGDSGGAPEGNSLAEETRLFRAALARLRVARDPHGALVLLDGYATAFPRGSYIAEASVARIDALLAAGRRADALAALRKLSLSSLPRRVELTVMRAELASAAGDCTGGRADFDAALAERLPTGLQERALYGRALCRERLGDHPGARDDLDLLLSRFPRSPLTEAARSSLGDP